MKVSLQFLISIAILSQHYDTSSPLKAADNESSALSDNISMHNINIEPSGSQLPIEDYKNTLPSVGAFTLSLGDIEHTSAEPSSLCSIESASHLLQVSCCHVTISQCHNT